MHPQSRRKQLKIVWFLQIAVPDLNTSTVSIPNKSGVAAGLTFTTAVDKGLIRERTAVSRELYTLSGQTLTPG
jgi:hypothetical protein